ncbi:hypothetical protein ACFX13_011132 [Malus domestica]
MASGSVPSRSIFFSGAVTSALNLLLWRRHLRAPPSSSTLRPPRRGGTNRDPVTAVKTEEDGVVGRQIAEQDCPHLLFYVVGLCCHIDEEHPVEAKNGAFCSISLFLV